jgi:GR25 family glycosyltransferase involved in LPS biosynthesis
MKQITDILHALYINLEERTDRKKKTKKEFKNLKIPIKRFNAVKLSSGRISCSMSHIKCLQKAIDNDWDHVLIVEDDIHFMNPEIFTQQLNKFLSSGIEWDVLFFAGNNLPPYQIFGDFCVKVSRCQTATGYLVKKHYYSKLLKNMKEGMALLLKEPDKHFYYAVDKYWFPLQEKDNWFIITPLSVVQREGYSNIELKETDYKSKMLDLDKKYMFTQFNK